MAVILKSKKMTLASLITRLFDDAIGSHIEDQASVLIASGFKLETGLSKFAISVDTGKEYTVVAEVPMKLETVKLCMKQQVGPAVLATIRAKIKKLISMAYKQMLEQEHPAGVYIPTPIKEPQKPVYISALMAKGDTMAAYHASGGGKVAAIKVFRNLTGATLKVCKTQVEKWADEEYNEVVFGPEDGPHNKKSSDYITGTVKEPMDDYEAAAEAVADYSEMKKKVNGGFDLALNDSVTTVSYWKSGSVVKIPVVLKNATKLHQPVRGTDPDSIYHVIAIGDDLVVAARIKKNHDVAIRAVIKVHHATAIAQRIVKGFLAAGLEKKKGGHWSLHLAPKSLLLAQRSIGSVLFAMSTPFAGITTQIEKLQGAGK